MVLPWYSNIVASINYMLWQLGVFYTILPDSFSPFEFGIQTMKSNPPIQTHPARAPPSWGPAWGPPLQALQGQAPQGLPPVVQPPPWQPPPGQCCLPSRLVAFHKKIRFAIGTKISLGGSSRSGSGPFPTKSLKLTILGGILVIQS